MSLFDRAKFVALHPEVAAVAFNIQINSFVDVILRHKHGPGIFGHCKVYYGTVEAQGCGTLHCHMLIWVAGNPSPQALRDQMSADPSFQDWIFKWLEMSLVANSLETWDLILKSQQIKLSGHNERTENLILDYNDPHKSRRWISTHLCVTSKSL